MLRTMGIELTIFLVISMIITVVVIYPFIQYKIVDPIDSYDTPFEENKDAFISGQYSQIDVEESLGKGSYFNIYDSNYNKVFTSSSKGKTLDKDIILLIPEEEYSQIKETKLNDGSIILENLDMDDNLVASTVFKESSLIYSTLDIPKNITITPNVVSLLKGKYNNFKVRKATFESLGKNYTAVFFTKDYNKGDIDFQIFMSIVYLLVIIAVIFLITVYMYLVRINIKISKPLKKLQCAVSEFRPGKIVNTNYKGPSEFEKIFEKFGEMADDINSLSEERRKALKERQRILADISHDLKTPITVINMYSDILLRKLIPEVERDEYIAAITKRASELNELINEFSDYNKLESPDFNLKTTKLNGFEYVRNYVIKRYDELQLLGFEIILDIPDKTAYIMLDEYQMKKVFDNILSNTMKYNEKGTKIYVKVYYDKDWLYIRLGDNGIGIPDELRKNIFEPFTVGDKARASGKGSGLGLSIARRIVSLHKGQIKLLSIDETNISTEYEIKLPGI